MPQTKKPCLARTATVSLIREHSSVADDGNCVNKARRLAVKDEIVRRAIGGTDDSARKYATKRGWQFASA